MRIIIKCYKKTEPNWDGKGFSDCPAIIYTNLEEAMRALRGYWYGEGAREAGVGDNRPFKVIHLTGKQKDKLLAEGKIRW